MNEQPQQVHGPEPDGSTGKDGGTPVTELRARNFWIAGGWALVGAVVLLSLWPARIVDAGGGHGDKGLHVFAYAVLMAWFASIHGEPDRRWRLAAGFVAMGITLELVQPLTGLRQFELADFVANNAGVLVGWATAPPRLPNLLQWVERAFSWARKS